MNDTVSLDEFRKNLSDIVGKVMYGSRTIIVQKHSRPGVVVISEREYESLRDPRKRFSSDKDWGKLFVLTDNVRKRVPAVDQAKLEETIDQEIKAVRTQKHSNPE